MKRLLRRLLDLLVVLLLLSSAGVAMLWMRSYFVADKIEFHRHIIVPSSSPTIIDESEILFCDHAGIVFSRAKATNILWNDFMTGAELEAVLKPHNLRWQRLPATSYAAGKISPFGPTGNGWALPRIGVIFSNDETHNGAMGMHEISLVVPCPIVFLVLLSATVAALWPRIRLRHLTRTGCCLKCGYDLRATPERCPECGTVPPKKEVISN